MAIAGPFSTEATMRNTSLALAAFQSTAPKFRRPVSDGTGGGLVTAAPSSELERASGGVYVPSEGPAEVGPSKAMIVAAAVVGVALVGFVVYRLKRKG